MTSCVCRQGPSQQTLSTPQDRHCQSRLALQARQQGWCICISLCVATNRVSLKAFVLQNQADGASVSQALSPAQTREEKGRGRSSRFVLCCAALRCVVLCCAVLCGAGTKWIDAANVAPICRSLGVDYAPALVGFEMQAGRMVPRIRGVVVCEVRASRNCFRRAPGLLVGGSFSMLPPINSCLCILSCMLHATRHGPP